MLLKLPHHLGYIPQKMQPFSRDPSSIPGLMPICIIRCRTPTELICVDGNKLTVQIAFGEYNYLIKACMSKTVKLKAKCPSILLLCFNAIASEWKQFALIEVMRTCCIMDINFE